MIRKVVIRRFKRFDEVTFDLPGHVVLAGPNNMGKTTLLQAIAAWGLALERWKQLNNYHRRGGAYAHAPIARQTFSAVPLRDFGLLWRNRVDRQNIEIEVQSVRGLENRHGVRSRTVPSRSMFAPRATSNPIRCATRNLTQFLCLR